uniref:Uncharacterized protein n=1 Tax=Panagrolaimus davidi TaxID=227884 RepID=A0A914PNQ6_9BILA
MPLASGFDKILAEIPIGWWMVNSGLHHELMANKKKPGVSQYRMAIHLIIPFFMFGVFLYSALSMFLKPQDVRIHVLKLSLKVIILAFKCFSH